MNMKHLFCFILLAFGITTQAQSYLITVEGDSLTGKFKILKDDVQGEFVRFKAKKKKSIAFNPTDIKRAVTKNGLTYKPIKIDGKYKFCTLELSGYANLYSFRIKEGAETFNRQIIEKVDGTSLVVPGLIGQRKRISEFLYECSSVSKDILDKEKYKRTALDEMVNDFNQCLENPSNQQVIRVEAPMDTKEVQTKRIEDFKTLLSYSDKVKRKDIVLEEFNKLLESLSNGSEVTSKHRKAFIKSLKKDQKLIELFEEIISF